MAKSTTRKTSRWQRRIARFRSSAQNAMEVMRLGRLGAPYRAPFTVRHQERVFKLRHYEGRPEGPDTKPLLLVPPLMVTSEIYDIAPELSAVAYLASQGVDVWLCDFGAPEIEEGGLERTLDDHVRAVSKAVDLVRDATGQDVHLAGYSQGGMFAYQAAAYRRAEGLRSIITFGSPVNIHRNLPVPMSDDIAERFISGARALLTRPLEHVNSLPGTLTSAGFKILSAKKEVSQIVDFFEKLHDRDALERRESRRRFLGGEGFVAWPGPALKTFIDEFIVHNRLASGGFVIDGRTVTLRDIDVPILYFLGSRDELARPAAVRALSSAAPNAELHEVFLRAGHFGLVVGSQSLTITWPTVTKWIRWRDGQGERPEILIDEATVPEEEREPIEEVHEAAFENVDFNPELLYDLATDAIDTVWNRLGDASREVGEMVDTMRWQLPRLSKIRRIEADTFISVGQALADQAEAIPNKTFFLWKGRAFSYIDADARVDNVVRGLIESGVMPSHRVGVLMHARPSYLTMVAAISRLGAVAVLLGPDMKRLSLGRALELGDVDYLVTDPENAETARSVFDGPVLVLGGGGDQRTLSEGVTDMEAIDPDTVELPDWYTPNPGQAEDLAMIVFTSGMTGEPRAARVTNRRWALAALGTAAAATLTWKDTVYCALPLHHASGALIAVSGALVGGARIALAPRFNPRTFWDDIGRYGASVVVYIGDMPRMLLNEPQEPGEDRNPVRLFIGSGMREPVWYELRRRFGNPSVVEFYASTEGNAVLANLSGEKVGSVGRPLPSSAEVALVGYRPADGSFDRDDEGYVRRVAPHEPGLLLARVDPTEPATAVDGYADREAYRGQILRNVFEPDDVWFVTGDWLVQDGDGDFRFLDRLKHLVRRGDDLVATTRIEDVVGGMPHIAFVAAYGIEFGGEMVPMVTVVLKPEGGLEPSSLARRLDEDLEPWERPRFIRIRNRVPMTGSYRVYKSALAELGLDADGDTLWWYDRERKEVRPYDGRARKRALRLLAEERSVEEPEASK